MLATFLDRLVQQTDPHIGAGGAAWQIRVASGRWLVLHRLSQRLSLASLSAASGVSLETLQLLESGLADESLAEEAAWERFAYVLAGVQGDVDWVWTMIGVANGRIATPQEGAVERMMADIGAVAEAAERNDW